MHCSPVFFDHVTSAASPVRFVWIVLVIWRRAGKRLPGRRIFHASDASGNWICNDVRMTSLKRDLGECWYYRSKFGVFFCRSRECELPIFLRMRVLVGQVFLTKSYASSWVFWAGRGNGIWCPGPTSSCIKLATMVHFLSRDELGFFPFHMAFQLHCWKKWVIHGEPYKSW